MKSRTKKILFILLFAIGILLLGQKNVSAYAENTISRTFTNEQDVVIDNRTVKRSGENSVLVSSLNKSWNGVTYALIYKPSETIWPKCTTNGRIVFRDSNNKLELKITIIAPGHKWTDWTTIVTGNCQKQTQVYRRCTVCNYGENDYLGYGGHIFTSRVDEEPTCQKAGVIGYKCKFCGTPNPNDWQVIPKLSHNYVNGVCRFCSKVKDSGSSGGSSGSGGGSGNGINEDDTEPEGTSTETHYHTWINATCTDPQTCSSCGETQGEALGHNWVDDVCTRCKAKASEITLNEWDISRTKDVTGAVKATLTADGILTITGPSTTDTENNGYIINFDKPSASDAVYINPINSVINKVKKVVIKGYVRNISTYLFYYDSNLTSVTIENPDYIKYIGEGAFFGCKKLESFSLPQNMIAIGARAFCHCQNLKEIDLSNSASLVRIGHEAFRDCWLLQSVYLPEGLKIIGYEAFFNDISLKNLFIPSTVVAIGTAGTSVDETGLGTDEIADAEKLKYANTTGKNNVFTVNFDRNVGFETEYQSCIKVVLEQNGITVDESKLLEQLNTYLQTANRVYYYSDTSIMKQYMETTSSADGQETGINELSWDISDAQDGGIIATLDKGGKLTVTQVTEGSTTIKNFNLSDMRTPWNGLRARIKTIYVGDGIETIGEYTFYWCNNLQEVRLPSSLSKISCGAFFGCVALENISIPANVKEIEERAFCHCENLKSITLPAMVTRLSREVFRDCYRLQTINAKGDINVINYRALFNCPSLTSFAVSPYVAAIEEEAFAVDFSVNGDTRWKAVESLTPCTITYYVNSEVMKEYKENYSGERSYKEINLQNIDIQQLPDKTRYFTGDNLETLGLILVVEYYNGSTSTDTLKKEIYNGYKCTPEEFGEEPKEQEKVIVEYGGLTTSFNVEIAEPQLLSISVIKTPNKVEYKLGEILDTTGLTILLYYENGVTQEITKGFTVDKTELDTVGEQEITVTYEGNIDTFKVTVNDKNATGISIETEPTKLSYIQNEEELDLAGGKINVTYDNNSTELIDMTATGVTTSGFDNTKLGKNTVTVTYKGFTTTFDVTIVEEVTPPPTEDEITITSGEYNVSDTHIQDIQSETTVEEFKTKISTNATQVKIYKNGKELSNTEVVGTGAEVELKLENTTEKYTLIIKGDTNGDGLANMQDMTLINKYRLNRGTLDSIYKLAGDLNNDGVVDIKDLTKINRFRLHKISAL